MSLYVRVSAILGEERLKVNKTSRWNRQQQRYTKNGIIKEILN